MYGWLRHLDSGVTSLETLSWNFDADPPALTDQQRRERTEYATTKLQEALGKTTYLKEALRKLSELALQAVSDDDAQFAVCMAIEFCRNEKDPVAAWKEIDRRIDREFGPTPFKGLHPKIARVVTRLKAVALTTPPQIRDPVISMACTHVRRTVMFRDNERPHELMPFGAEIVRVVPKILAITQPSLAKCAKAVAMFAITACRADTVKQMGDALLAVLDDPSMLDLFVKIMDDDKVLTEQRTPLLNWTLDSFRGAAIETASKTLKGGAGPATISSASVASAVCDAHGRLCDLCEATVDAIRRDVDFGPRTESNKAALEIAQVSEEGARERDLKVLLAKIERLTSAGAADDPADEAPEPSPPSALAQLVEWNEAPVFGAHKSPIDAAGISRKQRAKPRRRAPVKTQPVPEPRAAHPAATTAQVPAVIETVPATVDEDVVVTEPIVQRVGVAGLGAAAHFMSGELGDLVTLGKLASADAQLLAQCAAVQSELDDLARLASKAPAKFDLDRAQDTLTRAEEELTRLRGGIRIAKASADTQARFRSELCRLLATERQWRGRRDGGRIQCALTQDDWSWVHETYHARRVPGPRHVLWEQGRQVALKPDEALGLYVTLDSHTPGVAFDITVHVYRRLHPQGSPAEQPTPDNPFPLLDPQEWFDTYQPCYVAHVPRGQTRADTSRRSGTTGKPPVKK